MAEHLPPELPVFFSSFSALDRYYGEETGSYLSLASCGGLAELAVFFGKMEFPGVENADLLIPAAGGEGADWLISCDLPPSGLVTGDLRAVPVVRGGLAPLCFFYDPRERKFYDPLGVYPLLRSRQALRPGGLRDPDFSWEIWLDAAVMASRYGFEVTFDEESVSFPSGAGEGEGEEGISRRRGAEVPVFRQREVLVRILEGRDPPGGFRVLRRCGFLGRYWPELARMIRVDQNKEYHPEGDVWDHTMGTFAHRKSRDLVLSLALLFHDAGKPLAEEEQGHKFHNHAQIGRDIAGKFLSRLGFSPEIAGPAVFLVQEHMTPGFAGSRPSGRIGEVMASPLYPALLELFRCDLSSTFRGPGAYYEACGNYRQYLRNRRNPFRDSRGKKTGLAASKKY